MTSQMDIVGYSPTPTLHQLRLQSGATLYVQCGADILLNALSRDVEGKSRCPVCQKPIHLKFSQGRVMELAPSEVLLYAVEVEGRNGMICVVCEGSLLFDGAACLDKWVRGYKGQPGLVYKPQEYLDHCVKMGRPDLCPQ